MRAITALALVMSGLTLPLGFAGCSRRASPATPGGEYGPTEGAPAGAEDKAVAFVVELGGTVTRDEKAPMKPVILVRLTDTPLTDMGVKELSALKSLTTSTCGARR